MIGWISTVESIRVKSQDWKKWNSGLRIRLEKKLKITYEINLDYKRSYVIIIMKINGDNV